MENIKTELFEEHYMNLMQIQANAIDSNVLIAECARGAGKTEGIMGPRVIRVANDMPGELSFLVHKTYAALLTNVWPNIQTYFSKEVTINGQKRPMLEYGFDYIVGESKIPSHFRRPRYPVLYPKHSIIFRNGHHLQLVSSDQPESVAGRSGVHAFVEEMKHNKGEKLKTRLFPSLRGGSPEARKSHYYQGITGVSDTARVDLGEDNWFEEYEHSVNKEVIEDIVTASLFLNNGLYKLYKYEQLRQEEKNPVLLESLRIDIEKEQRKIALWKPRLANMRRNANYYIRASTFVNKDFLGPSYFKQQMNSMEKEEFLTAICAIRQKEVVNKFFASYDRHKHQFSDGYKRTSILRLDLKDHFVLTSRYLKYYNRNEELLVGYDPGSFSSMVVGQERNFGEECRILKEFYCYAPKEQPELARAFFDFFGEEARNKHIVLYHDRAANKKKEEKEKVTTDARILKRELENYGFSVELMNEGQSTIFHWMQYKLLLLIFSERTKYLPRVLIDENECPNLCSSILLSPLKKTDSRVELDKTSEIKVAMSRQAGLSTQLPSALIYLLHGRYADRINDLSSIPDDLPPNMIV
jgi:hypothetical protein